MREKKLSIRLGDKLHAELSKKAGKYNQSVSEFVRGVLIKEIEEGVKLDQKYIWVLENPDNEHWDEKFAQEEISRISQKWNVKAVSTSQTRDSGHGQERLYVVSGNSEAVEEFKKELDVALY
jgi:metal-responsive CopG/Arc/MetJ family transcriptional regulator